MNIEEPTTSYRNSFCVNTTHTTCVPNYCVSTQKSHTHCNTTLFLLLKNANTTNRRHTFQHHNTTFNFRNNKRTQTSTYKSHFDEKKKKFIHPFTSIHHVHQFHQFHSFHQLHQLHSITAFQPFSYQLIQTTVADKRCNSIISTC